jgi:glycine/D-amino acid oxidase-like deaminating enzyme
MGDSMESDGVSDRAAVYETLDVEAARAETMCHGEGLVGALKYEAGSIHAYKFATGVLELCLQKGLNLQTHTPVTELGHLDGGGRFRTAVTRRGTIAAENIIVATNGYASHLLPQLRGRVVPLRGQITAQRPSSRLTAMNPHGLPTTYSFIYPGGYEYMIPRPPLPGVPVSAVGSIIIGGGLGVLPERGLSEYGETNDCDLNGTNSSYLRKTLPRFFGDNWGPDDAVVEKEWTGVMGATEDGLPFVGEVPGEKGLWVSAGFNGHGSVSLFLVLELPLLTENTRDGTLLKMC